MNLDDIDPDHVSDMNWWGHYVVPGVDVKLLESGQSVVVARSVWDPLIAEGMLSAARKIMHPPHEIVEAVGVTDWGMALAKVVIDFSRMPASFKLRAQVEGWDRQRIIREMY